MGAHPRRPRPSRPVARRHRPLLALRRRPRLRWVAVAVLAVFAATLVHALGTAAEAERVRWGTSTPVAVALRDLAPGDQVTATDVELRPLPAALVPGEAVREVPAGATVTATVFRGEALVAGRLAPEGLSTVAALVPAGHRAVAVPTAAGTVPPLAPGDAVDVLVAHDPSGLRPPVVAAERATVVHADDHAVTVAVPQADAPAVALASATGMAALALAGA